MALIATSGWEDYALLILRIFIGVIFIAHGYHKIIHKKELSSKMGKAKAKSLIFLLGIFEIILGVAVILGLLTQIAAIGFLIIMAGALVFNINMKKIKFISIEDAGWDLNLILLGVAVLLIIFGAGYLSFDFLLGIYP
ncbi:DoxX family protein [Candidatus Pacearchaeota archaeon]|nr:DoxX family protein [Candidatus Pacearchaeota archaeon]